MHDEHHMHPARGESPVEAAAFDPVCGMTVDADAARTAGLVSHHGGTERFFCGRGCKLEFDEDPARYLDPGYRPSM